MARSPQRLIERAWEEFAASREPGDPDRQLTIRRQAAEKAWVHVTEATDRLLGVRARDETAHTERYHKLVELDDPRLLALYAQVQRELHGDCFYHGSCPAERVERLLREAEEFPRHLEGALQRRRRSR